MLPNKVPFKEQKRHWDYQFNQDEKQQSRMGKKEIKRLEEAKRKFIEEHQGDDSYESDKDRQAAEVYAMLMNFAEKE